MKVAFDLRDLEQRDPKLCDADTFGLRTLLALPQFELNALAFFEGAEAIHLDGGPMHKDVVAGFIHSDEAVAFFGVEPFNGSQSHDAHTFAVAKTGCRDLRTGINPL